MNARRWRQSGKADCNNKNAATMVSTITDGQKRHFQGCLEMWLYYRLCACMHVHMDTGTPVCVDTQGHLGCCSSGVVHLV